MAILTRNNCKVDPKSGGVIFHGSPEFQEIVKLREELNAIDQKLDKLIAILERGVSSGREMETSGLSASDG